MSFIQNPYIQIILSSVSVYLFVVVAIRLFGKKDQLERMNHSGMARKA